MKILTVGLLLLVATATLCSAVDDAQSKKNMVRLIHGI